MSKHFKHNPLVEIEEEQEKELSNVTDLRLITGGKEPPTTADNWLSGLEKGTLFLIQDKNNPQDFNLGCFMVREKTDKAVVLTTSSAPTPMYVNPVRFCNKFSLYETLAVFEMKSDTEEPSARAEEAAVDTEATSVD